MKRKASKTPSRTNPVQLRPNARDEKILEFLRGHNRTLADADILRLAIDTLAEEQGMDVDALDEDLRRKGSSRLTVS